MDMINRYLKAVERELPEDKKVDIIRELRANLLDEIEAKTSGNPSQADNKTVAKILIENGHPQTTALQYAPLSPLVASDDMPLYKRVISHSAMVLFLFSLLMGSTHLVEQQSINVFSFLYQIVGNFVSLAAPLLIAVTWAFYYLGKHGQLSQWQSKKWSPYELPAEDVEMNSRSDSISEVITNVFGLLIMWTPLWMAPEVANKLILGFSSDMEHWRIILTVVAAISLAGAVYRLFFRYWTKLTLGAYILEYFVYIAGMLYLSTQPQLIVITNSQASDLTPILASILDYAWYIGAIILTLLVIKYIKQWRRL
ncbi:hypothetical protein KJ365_05550 [Glaciecola sp. XM2]|jgi:hypothetical protein|uniref:hypothetical protein n=1 Tax=Glaciecola sp. XM2 TaxID=1914931 RepID=UPI001BDF280A|nr:hypothetical protein [Glaciecola sp. XM2]MBT1450339.1 hypothetical protein [Glaciecola sp. XM2]